MDAVDNWIPEPVRQKDKDFLMPIEDVFSITGRGTVATGRIETGVIHTGDAVDIIGMGAEKLKSTVTGVEMFRKILDEGEAGDNVGLLLRGIDKNEIRRGMVIAKPGSVKPHHKFEAAVYILKGHAWRQPDDHRRAYRRHRSEREPALRYPRGWPYRWFGSGDQDSRIIRGYRLLVMGYRPLTNNLYRGIVKWYNGGLQNRGWEFDSLCPCQLRKRKYKLV